MRLTIIICLCIYMYGCAEKEGPLPILGNVNVENGDTIYHTIPDFSFLNQDSVVVDNSALKDYIYISDFFFTYCPSICPKVKRQMLRLYDTYKDEDQIKFVSHGLDGVRDTPSVLKTYAYNLGVDTDKWMFLTGPRGAILDIADDYFVAAFEDADAPGGFDHSGKIVLVDKNRHVRAFCEGTDPDDVTDFFPDVEKLLAEYKSK